MCWCVCFFFFQAEDGIRDLVRSRGLGDVYKRQADTLKIPHQIELNRSSANSSEEMLPAPILRQAIEKLSLIHI